MYPKFVQSVLIVMTPERISSEIYRSIGIPQGNATPKSTSRDLGLWVKTSGRSLCRASRRVSSFFFPVFSCQQRLVQDPHLIERDYHHDQKTHRHEGIARQHG